MLLQRRLIRPLRVFCSCVTAPPVSVNAQRMFVGARSMSSTQLERNRQLILQAARDEGLLAKLVSDPSLASHFEAIASSDTGAKIAANKDSASQREELLDDTPEHQIPPPSWLQLRRLAMISGLPFVGFGFLDNSLMLVVPPHPTHALHRYLLTSFHLRFSSTCLARSFVYGTAT